MRDYTIWLCRFALGWRPVECVRLTLGDVRRAVASADGYITREQKHRHGKENKSPSPIIPEVLDVLELAESMADLPDEAPIFYGTSGRHQGKPLGDQGVRGVIRKLFEEAEVHREITDAIPYDLRDSFAAHVGRAVRAAQGGRVGEARDVARRLLGHGDGGDVLNSYWNDDERHLELLEYNPLRQAQNEGRKVDNKGFLVEIEGLEPSASALRTPRSPN